MIKQFPKFSRLAIEQRHEVKRITSQFEPYSDFDFTSLLCWDIDGSSEISLLNGNLVIMLPDYITGKKTYSLLGKNKIDESLKSLITKVGPLSLVPEIMIRHIKDVSAFTAKEDRDNFDYIYELKSLVEFPGKKYKVKRNKNHNFMSHYQDKLSLRNIQFGNAEDRAAAEQVFVEWAEERDRKKEDIANEAAAIGRALAYAPDLKLTGILVYIDGHCVGFSINEILDSDYSICHFQKAILAYEHLDVFISNLVAKELLHFGCKYANWEQDLGIDGLRALKTSYQHFSFLKKYNVDLVK
ncbi:MAG: phosphatidylglycerol lysyltransferase domain-containing protein [Candidatus Saccharibacteria bacterium]